MLWVASAKSAFGMKRDKANIGGTCEHANRGREGPAHAALEGAIAEWPLESHPFLERFSKGGFGQDAIRWWAIKMLPGSNRFNQAFLKVTARVDDYRARILLLNNIYSEHGELNPSGAHVELFMRFMRGIGCSRVDVHEDDGAFRVPELRFKRFEIQDNEPIVWSLGRFAAIECVLPGVFTKYIEGLRKIFPSIDDHTIEYFPIHCILDPEHTDQLLEVASLYVNSDIDVMTFQDGVRDMLLSMSDMFSWMGRNMAHEAGGDEILRSTLPALATVSSKGDSHLTDADIYDGIYEREEIPPRQPLSCLTGSPASPHLRCWISVRAPGHWPGC